MFAKGMSKFKLNITVLFYIGQYGDHSLRKEVSLNAVEFSLDIARLVNAVVASVGKWLFLSSFPTEIPFLFVVAEAEIRCKVHLKAVSAKPLDEQIREQLLEMLPQLFSEVVKTPEFKAQWLRGGIL